MQNIKVTSIDDFPILSGIYKFTNKINDKIYIGESMNFARRMNSHVTKSRNKSWTAVISAAFRKYGFSNFEYEIIESYPLNSVTKEFLLEREAFYIKDLDAMNPEKGYNRCSYGANTIGYKFSDESKKKMSLAKIGTKHTPEQIRKRVEKTSGDNHWLRRNPVPKEMVDRFVQNNLTREITDQERANKSLGHLNSENKPRRPIFQLDKETGEIIRTWRSLSDAVRYFGKRSSSDISNSTRHPHKSAYGFKWRFLTEEEKKTAILETCHKEGFQCERQIRYKRQLSRL